MEVPEKLLVVARAAAQSAAEVHSRMKNSRLEVHTKGSSMDLVTAVDREAEQKLVSVIRGARPHDTIVGEEGTDFSGSSGVSWILDPLDGTTNFVYGYPSHAVAIGVEIDGKRLLGVVCDTYNGRLYSGILGAGAECDGRRMVVGTSGSLSQALVGTGFLPDATVREAQGKALTYMLPLVRDVRRSGCPALDFCAVAAGRLDAYYESGLKRWDIAAGAAIAEAAGAEVAELQSAVLPNPVVVAANPKLLKAMIEVLSRAGVVETGVTDRHR